MQIYAGALLALSSLASVYGAAIDLSSASHSAGEVVSRVAYGAGSAARGASLSFSAQHGAAAVLKAPIARIRLSSSTDDADLDGDAAAADDDDVDARVVEYLPTSGPAAINAALKPTYAPGAPVRGRRFGRPEEVDARRRKLLATIR